jgi:hypothetical protein
MASDWTVRFWRNVSKSESCWLWTGSLDDRGYGNLGVRRPGSRITQRAHRLSWEIHHGPIAGGLSVLHKCDVRHCVNPEHLYLGTQKDNVHDSMSRGRQVLPNQVGSRHSHAKLDEDMVRHILWLDANKAMRRGEIAKMLNITASQITAICHGRAWAHVDPDQAARRLAAREQRERVA